MSNPYRNWKEWDATNTKLLQKRNKAERALGLRGAGDKERLALDKANAAIEAHKVFYIPSTPQSSFHRRLL